jgi:hypothetical protein
VAKRIVSPKHYGVSFSIKQCRNFGLDAQETLDWLLKDAGFRRFRLMSYWNEMEKVAGEYDFSHLDDQVNRIAKHHGVISLCLGARQPRWPENHWPEWAWKLPKAERDLALLNFVAAVVRRYKHEPAIHSYQLENEALLQAFGERPEVDRGRLRREYELVKTIDPERPIIMTTSTSWGIPFRQPIPDIVGFSYYQMLYSAERRRYTTAFHNTLLHKTRAACIRLLHTKPVFVHELQLEPWGPTAIWKMPPEEQDKSMGPEQIQKNLQLANRLNLHPIDLWGGEWWYWRLKRHGDPSVWQTVAKHIGNQAGA